MDRIRLKILGLSYSMSQSGAYALILSDEADLKRIPIVIGISEAQSIAVRLEQVYPKRPLTHDLIKELSDAMGLELKEVFIYNLESGIFYSKLLFENESRSIELDSRTSDAVALALRYDCPIYTTQEIMDKASITENQEQHEVEEMSVYTVSELNRMLQEAIENEEYEKASEIKAILNKKSQR